MISRTETHARPRPAAQAKRLVPWPFPRIDGSTYERDVSAPGISPRKPSPRPAPSRGEYRAGGRVHTPSRVAPPVGRHQLPARQLHFYLLRKQLTRLVCVCVCVCFGSRSYPRTLASDLKRAGFNALSVASMHTNDRGLEGIYQTIDSLTAANIPAAGARRDPTEDDTHWYRLVRAGDWNTAFVACTDDTNMDLNQRDLKTQVTAGGPFAWSLCCGDFTAGPRGTNGGGGAVGGA